MTIPQKKQPTLIVKSIVLMALALFAFCLFGSWWKLGNRKLPAVGDAKPSVRQTKTPRTIPEKIVARARLEAERSVFYDASYQKIAYPNGDVSSDRGACTDVIVRALRAAGYDLQKLIYLDKKAHPGRYPGGGSNKLDPNIDHRRIPNHIAFFKAHGVTLANRIDGNYRKQWQPGDFVYVDLGGGLLHCGVVSDAKNEDGLPLLIHNIGPTAREEDGLTSWRIIGHYRYPRPARAR